jgi:6-phosphofructokinase 1
MGQSAESVEQERQLYDTLKARVRDNLEWMLAFDEDRRLVRNSQAERFGAPYFRTPWSEEPGSESRITPHDAAIPLVDDDRVLAAFWAAQMAVPKLLLAGERAEHCWGVDKPLRVGVLTAGGNAPGLNMVVDSVTKRHHEFRKDSSDAERVEVYAYLGGFPGLLAPDEHRVALVPSHGMVRQTDRYHHKVRRTLVTDDFALEACTRLKTKRGDKSEKALDDLAHAVAHENLDVLHIVGGDGSMRAAHGLLERFRQRHPNRRLAVVCAVKTMDNDVVLADPSFGFYTVVDEAMEFIRRIAKEAETQDRIAIIQLFGAASGFVALYSGYCSGEVDWVVLPETLPHLERSTSSFEAEDDVPNYVAYCPPIAKTVEEYVACIDRLRDRMVKHIRKRVIDDKKGHAVVVVAEGATPKLMYPREAMEHAHSDDFRRKKEEAFHQLVNWFRNELTKAGVSNDVMHSMPQHLIRSTQPNGFDAALCKYTGKLLADSALAGYTDCAVSMWHGRPALVPLKLMIDQKKFVQPNGYFAASMLRKLAPGEW